MRLVWNPTGDEILLDAVNDDVLQHYRSAIKENCTFRLSNCKIDAGLAEQLANLIDDVVPALERAGIKSFSLYRGADFLDQAVLNGLHREYVLAERRFNVGAYLEKLGRPRDIMPRINSTIHDIENMWLQTWMLEQDVPVSNPWAHSKTSFDTHNLSLRYNDLGRMSWEKFNMFDEDMTDLSNFHGLGNMLDITLYRPRLGLAAPAYTYWCEQHGIPAAGTSIPLADFPDLGERMTIYRHMLVRNRMNTLTIED
jgi:hypothetical protein